MKLVQLTYTTKQGERTSTFIKLLKGYVPIQITEEFVEPESIRIEKEISINEITGKVKR